MCRRFPCCYSFTRRGGQRRRQAHRRGKLNGIWILPVWCMQPCRTSGRVYILPPLIKIDEWLVASRGVFKSNASALHHDTCTVLFFFSLEMIQEYIYIYPHTYCRSQGDYTRRTRDGCDLFKDSRALVRTTNQAPARQQAGVPRGHAMSSLLRIRGSG